MAKILLAEDDENLGFMVQDNLTDLGHDVTWAKNGDEALSKYQSCAPSLCLIDVMMPKMDGFDLARKIRAQDEWTPILFLTAKSIEGDRLKGFEVGGDDYITKPFSMKELSYRINVFLRRKIALNTHGAEKIEFGKSRFDPSNICYEVNEDRYPLTQMEGKLLALLVANKNMLVKRETILESIWGENDYFKGRSLDVFITRLRKYLKADDSLTIKNHHGVGFSLMIK